MYSLGYEELILKIYNQFKKITIFIENYFSVYTYLGVLYTVEKNTYEEHVLPTLSDPLSAK
jgi:hypothetical protein